MKLDDVRDLKAKFLNAGVPAMSALLEKARPQTAVLSRTLDFHEQQERSSAMVGVGVSPNASGDGYSLAIRLGDPALRDSKPVRDITRTAKGEVDLRVVGIIHALATPWQQSRQRPIQSGISVGHFRVTAGTLGAFVRLRQGDDDKTRYILSNNHVLADVNRGRKGDEILQPGSYDGGRRPEDVVARLEAQKKITFSGANQIDAAVAKMVDGITIIPDKLRGLGVIAGVAPAEEIFEEHLPVRKLGRTTGVTKGIITAAELDGLRVTYENQSALFNNQIEIQSSTNEPFSRGGDSGSLVVDKAGYAVGLLFAGTDTGGLNGIGLTYANPIHAVLDALKVDLVIA